MSSPVPVTGKTPIYGLEFLVEGEPARNTRAKLERNALTIEAALQAKGLTPPGAPEYAALLADTGWVPLTPAAPFTALPYGMRYRIRGGLVSVRLGASLGASYTANATITTLPAPARPTHDQWFGGLLFGGATAGVQLLANGTLSLAANTTAGGLLVTYSYELG